MKKSFLIFTGIAIFAILPYAQFLNYAASKPAQQVKEAYLKNIDDFLVSIDSMSAATKKKDLKELQNCFIISRMKYKAIEPLSAYLDKGLESILNGPNLLKGDPNMLVEYIIEPKGLQVLEELIFAEDVIEHFPDINRQIHELRKNVQVLRKQSEATLITDRIIFEAARAELVRIFALGITGFDSPVLARSIDEAVVATTAIKNMLLPYQEFFSIRSPSATPIFFAELDDAIAYLTANNDFDNFDRLYFLKKYINPLYGQLYDLHAASGIEMPKEVNKYMTAVNYEAKNIFAEDFLDPWYYNRLREDSRNEKSIDLGRILFIDPVLSANFERSCASCHDADKAFTDGLEKSVAFDFSGNVMRNAPTLVNAIYSSIFFHDGRENFPENQVDHVLFNTHELSSNYETVIARLNHSPEYLKLFKEAFPTYPGIDGYTITKAMADYLRSLTALNSPFDKYMRGETEYIEEEVKRGFNIFMGKAACGTCHFAPTFNGTLPPDFTESETEVLGVPGNIEEDIFYADTDLGKYHFIPNSIYKGAFKTPTVRNISLTAPYMHNGVFSTLEEVMNFYNKGGGTGFGLDVPNQTLPSDPLDLSENEIADIIAFMHSLTDTTGTTDIPLKLPEINLPEAANRSIGGSY